MEGMNVGTVAAGRIGLAVLKRMKPFDCNFITQTGIVFLLMLKGYGLTFPKLSRT